MNVLKRIQLKFNKDVRFFCEMYKKIFLYWFFDVKNSLLQMEKTGSIMLYQKSLWYRIKKKCY